ncbi:MAG: LCP family protein, partial [Actinobacteria bacterium]|nr:LCP family protein [Actinomycetota bacterium]
MSSTPPPGYGGYSRKPPPEGDGTEAPKKKRYWWRFTLASVIIVAVAAAATSSAVLLYINSIAEAFGTGHNKELHKEVEEVVTNVHGGEPETILILGSDQRANLEEEHGRSDTTILLRLDAGKNLISVMSIPRDLKVELPFFGPEKFNAAYSYGGPKLTVRVVKALTGLQINHVINIDFLGFVRAVDKIGCVYTDVDRRYFHSNVGVPPEEQYSEINIQPGYQKLCGKKALQYVRYRHTDTDIVRSARQQSFLSQVRRQVSPTDLVTDNNNLVDTLAEYTSSDIKGGTELITLLDLLYELRGAEVQQIHFPAELGPSFVYSNETEIRHAVKEFLGEAGYQTQKAELKEEEEKAARKKKRQEERQKQGKGGGKTKEKKKHKKKKPKKHVPPGGDELVPATELGEQEAEIVARHVGGGFPVFYPTRLPSGANFVESNPYEHIVDPRVYHLKDKEKERHAAYRMVAQYQPEYEVNYFGVQGIQGWEDPPILDDPTEEKTVNGRDYSIYTDSGKIKLVAWHRGENTYWISNSLQQSLTNEQMMGIAESSHVIVPKQKTAKKGS